MGKIIYSIMASLDGFIEGPNRELNWVIIDEELHTYVNDQVRKAGALLYGRETYEIMADYWPTADQNPSAPEFIVEFARIWQRKPKIVFSRTLETIEGDSKLLREVVSEEITKLKEQYRGDLLLGGADLAASFMRLGLIDEYWIYVQPVLLGSGTPLFQALDSSIALELVQTHRFGSGVVFLDYQAKR